MKHSAASGWLLAVFGCLFVAAQVSAEIVKVGVLRKGGFDFITPQKRELIAI